MPQVIDQSQFHSFSVGAVSLADVDAPPSVAVAAEVDGNGEFTVRLERNVPAVTADHECYHSVGHFDGFGPNLPIFVPDVFAFLVRQVAFLTFDGVPTSGACAQRHVQLGRPWLRMVLHTLGEDGPQQDARIDDCVLTSSPRLKPGDSCHALDSSSDEGCFQCVSQGFGVSWELPDNTELSG